MGFWDRDVRDSFDELFDYNRDGHLDIFEREMQLDYIEGEKESEVDSEEEDEETEDLFSLDIDWDDLEDIAEDKLREVIEDAGYDLDEYDDYS